MVTRRDFLKTMAMTSAGFALGSGEMLHGANVADLSIAKPKAGKVKIAYIGIGNRGEQIINDFERTGMTEVVALCDVCMGQKHTQKVMNKQGSLTIRNVNSVVMEVFEITGFVDILTIE